MKPLEKTHTTETDWTDLYSVLGVARSASFEEVKAAYKKLAGVYHPDKKTGDAEKFKVLHHAYTILIDPVSRQNYDATGFHEGTEAKKVEAARKMVETGIENIIESNDDLRYINMEKTLRKNAERVLRSSERDAESVRKKLKRLNKFKKRAGGLALSVFEGMIEKESKELKTIEETTEVIELAIMLIDEVHYEFEERQENDGKFSRERWTEIARKAQEDLK